MSVKQPVWKTDSTSGLRYYLFRKNGQLGYALEDGQELNQHEFDQLSQRRFTPLQDPSIPRSTPTEVPLTDRLGHSLPRANTGPTAYGPDLRSRDSRASQLAAAESPPEPNYALFTPEDPVDIGQRRPDTASNSTRASASLHPSDQRSRRQTEHAGESLGLRIPTRDANQAAQQPALSLLSRLSQQFASIGVGEYPKLRQFVQQHREIVSQHEIDRLISEARNERRQHNDPKAQRLIHHALLLRKLKELSNADEVSKLFRRLDDKQSETRRVFLNGVNKVFTEIQPPTTTQEIPAATPQVGSRSTPVVTQVASRIVDRDERDQHAPGRTSRERLQGVDRSDSQPYGRNSGPNLPSQGRGTQENYATQSSEDGRGYTMRPKATRPQSSRGKEDDDPRDLAQDITRMSLAQDPSNDPKVSYERGRGAIGQAGNLADPVPTWAAAPPKNRRPSMSSNQMPTWSEEKAGEFEVLDRRYQKRPDATAFFKVGRVFSVVWSEPAGFGTASVTTSDNRKTFVRGRFGEEIFSHVLRMVVVREFHGSCWCLPINTYGGRGVAKSGFSIADRQAHTIIHMSNTSAQRKSDERDMVKKPIAVDPISPDQVLDRMSRLNFNKVHTVQWNLQVMNIGKVTAGTMHLLVQYFEQS